MRRNYFDEPVASTYDEDEAAMFDPAVLDPCVDLLAELAAGGPALELAIGTGRVALPLARRGVPVHGIDLSEAMVQRLAAKLAGEPITTTVGDFSSTRVEGAFTLAYLVFNTVMNLTSQEQQVACFQNAAEHLEPGGRFVVEVSVPDLQRLPLGETIRPFEVGPTKIGLDEYDVLRQGLVSHHFRVVGDALRQVSVPFRYVWPAELDLMARLAGMSLEARWADWDRSAFTSTSPKHVSVWRKDEGAGD